MGFSRQEYWSGLPFPSLGDLPDPGIEPRSPAWQADTLTSEPPGKTRKEKVTRYSAKISRPQARLGTVSCQLQICLCEGPVGLELPSQHVRAAFQAFHMAGASHALHSAGWPLGREMPGSTRDTERKLPSYLHRQVSRLFQDNYGIL